MWARVMKKLVLSFPLQLKALAQSLQPNKIKYTCLDCRLHQNGMHDEK